MKLYYFSTNTGFFWKEEIDKLKQKFEVIQIYLNDVDYYNDTGVKKEKINELIQENLNTRICILNFIFYVNLNNIEDIYNEFTNTKYNKCDFIFSKPNKYITIINCKKNLQDDKCKYLDEIKFNISSEYNSNNFMFSPTNDDKLKSLLDNDLISKETYDKYTIKPKIRLHIFGLPHTITNSEFSHCAFTGKVLRFPKMMQSCGYEVYHYGVEGSETEASKEIVLMTKNEWEMLRIQSIHFLNPKLTPEEIITKLKDKTNFVGDLGNVSVPLYQEFNKRLNIELKKNYRHNSTDIVCLPFGPGHEDALQGLNVLAIESGIGYGNSYKNYRIFESYAVLHQTLKQENKNVQNYWFVVPNYYNILEFPLNLNPLPKTVGLFGRVIVEKGCSILVEIAKKMPDVTFIICGQGDPSLFLTEPNIIYKPPIHGDERGQFLGKLTALLAPTFFCEPFCGSSVEAQLCGTPIIAHDFGAFSETVEPFKTGIHCHTLADFCYGIQMAIDGKFDRQYIHDRAVRLYDMYNVAHKYKYAFETVLDIHNGKNGWYSPDTHMQHLSNYFSI